MPSSTGTRGESDAIREPAILVPAHLADTALAGRDQTPVAAGVAADAPGGKPLVERALAGQAGEKSLERGGRRRHRRRHATAGRRVGHGSPGPPRAAVGRAPGWSVDRDLHGDLDLPFGGNPALAHAGDPARVASQRPEHGGDHLGLDDLFPVPEPGVAVRLALVVVAEARLEREAQDELRLLLVRLSPPARGSGRSPRVPAAPNGTVHPRAGSRGPPRRSPRGYGRCRGSTRRTSPTGPARNRRSSSR